MNAYNQARKLCQQVTKESMSMSSQSVPVNTRVWHMFEEAMEFKPHIEQVEREVAVMEAATTDLFDVLMPLLQVPLPRVWKMVEGGRGEPIKQTETHGHPIHSGGDYNPVDLKTAVARYDKGTRMDIRRPLATWLDSLELARERFPELQRLYKEVAKSSRKLLAATTDSGHNRAVPLTRLLGRCVGQPSVHEERQRVGARSMAEHQEIVGQVARQQRSEEHSIKIKDRQRKFEAARASFDQQEGLMFDHLSGLCRDASWLKSYMASELVLLKELMQEATYWLGPTMQPLPVVENQRLDIADRSFADNVDLICVGRPQYLDNAEAEFFTDEPLVHIDRAPASAKSPLEGHTATVSKEMVPRLPPTPAPSPTEALASKVQSQAQAHQQAVAVWRSEA